MALTPTQKTTLKNFIDADPTLSVIPNTEDGNIAIANVLNLVDSGPYWVWRSAISRELIYHTTGPTGTLWDWQTYKNQGATEQNAWVQMFMGDAAPMGNVNFRQGVQAIFTGSAPQVAQRNHIFAVGRRAATVAEKLFAVAVTNPPSNTGNNSGDARGSATNPDNLGFEGTLSGSDVGDARSNG